MEQQSISIAKAGVVCSLPARYWLYSSISCSLKVRTQIQIWIRTNIDGSGPGGEKTYDTDPDP
jgi:hypothetical protein